MQKLFPLIISNASENWGYQVVILYAATLDAASNRICPVQFSVFHSKIMNTYFFCKYYNKSHIVCSLGYFMVIL